LSLPNNNADNIHIPQYIDLSKLQPTKTSSTVETARSLWYKQKVYICDLIAQLLAKTWKRKQRQSFDGEKKLLKLQQISHHCHRPPPKTGVKQTPLQTLSISPRQRLPPPKHNTLYLAKTKVMYDNHMNC
jgi:hypothetical protein